MYYYHTADLSRVPESNRIRLRVGNWILCRVRYRFQIVAVLRGRANGCYDTRGRQLSKDSNDDHPLSLLPPKFTTSYYEKRLWTTRYCIRGYIQGLLILVHKFKIWFRFRFSKTLLITIKVSTKLHNRVVSCCKPT